MRKVKEKENNNIFDMILAISLGLLIFMLLYLVLKYYILLYMNKII